jgi:hypothetical protein
MVFLKPASPKTGFLKIGFLKIGLLAPAYTYQYAPVQLTKTLVQMRCRKKYRGRASALQTLAY